MLHGVLFALSALLLTSGAPLDAEPPLADALPGPIREPSAPDAWGGPRTGSEPTLSQRVADYQLKAVLDPVAHTVRGSERLTWRNRAAVPVKALYFHLYLNAFESEGSTFAIERRRLGRFRSDVPTRSGEWGWIELRRVRQGGQDVPWDFVHPDDGPETDHTVVRLELPEPVPPGGQVVLDIDFFDQLPRVVARTGYFGFFHLVGQWYPKVGVLELPGERGARAPRWNCHEFHLNSEFYADFGAYQLEVVSPPEMTVAASGVREGAPTDEPDGLHHRFHVEDVHDVVFSAWDGFAPPLSGSTEVPGGGTVAVEVLYPPELEPSARATLEATLDALRFFSAELGPYPYPHVTVVLPPFNAAEAGGVEYETFFTGIGGVALPKGSPDEARTIAIHEFGHGYFMGLLATNEFEEPFLDEGLDEWIDGRMLDQRPPLRLLSPSLLSFLGLRVPPFRYWNGALLGSPRAPPDPIGAPSWGRWSTGSYGQVYSRTPLVMRDLSTLLGPEVTARAIKAYYARWHHRHPSAADLREAFVEAGADRAVVERWFEEQVWGAAPVDDRVEALSTGEALPLLGSQPADGGRVALEEAERHALVTTARSAFRRDAGLANAAGPFPCRSSVALRRYGAGVPRTVELTFADGSTEELEWPASQRWRRLEVERPTCVTEVRLDAAGTLLLDLNRLDDVYLAEPQLAAAAGVGGGTLAWLQLLLAWVVSL